MKKEPIPKSKVVNPWPNQKRRAYKIAIEWDLKTYIAMKAEIEEELAELREIDEIAAPCATDIRENIYLTPKDHCILPRQEGDVPVYMHAKSTYFSCNDPTADKAEEIRRYRSRLLSGTEFKEMVRRVNAIERVIERLERSSITENQMRANLIKRKYFNQEESDYWIMVSLNLSKTTYYTWIKKTLYEIAKELGIVI